MLSPSVSRSTRGFALLIAASVLAAQAYPQSKTRANIVSRVSLAESLLPEVAKSRFVSKVSATEKIALTVALQPRDLAGLQKVADAVSAPESPLYRHYLTPQEIGERFGASKADRQAVVTYLASKGLTVTLDAPNGMAIMAEGTAENVQSAFGTTLANYKGPNPEGNTISFRANATAMTVPTALASVMTYVSGVETYNRPKPRDTTNTLTPQQISSGFNLTPTFNAGYTGLGRHVAFSNFDGLRTVNASRYISYYGLPTPVAGALSNVTFVIVGTAASSGTDVEGEGDLDLQMELGQAPLADIRIYDSTTDRLGVITRESTDNWADVISESYGWSGSATTFNSWHNIQVALTAQGITYMAATGDSSTHLSPYGYPDFDPEVLMVGGSITTVDTTTGAHVSDSGWSYSGGGWYNSPSGVTTFNTTLPSWQKGVGVPTNVPRRLLPDVSFQAAANNSSTYNPGGVYVVYTPFNNGVAGSQGLYSFDGTSCASPMFAAMLGMIQGRISAYDTSGNRFRMGRIQDIIYAQNATALRSDVYHDITVGTGLYKLPTASTGTSNSYNGVAQAATTGWDYLTGFGTMDIDGFYRSLLPVAKASFALGNYTGGDPTTVPVTVEFRSPGTMTAISSQIVYPAADGTLTVTAPGTGTFDVAFKANHWLRQVMASQTFTVNATTSMAVSLINGDVNGDNSVSAGDLAVIKVALGTSVGDPGYNASADLNGDGSISAADLSIAIVRLGQVGDN